ncbi:MAG: Cu(I)/Ag(I) efflux system membrane fusion protein [Paraglaciecola sp.]|jgi:Cu(I)/Ag(I) efflux system membrane fusion protein
MKNLLQNKYVLIGLTLVIGAVIGWVIKPSSNETHSESAHDLTMNEQGVFTCSMHPQIRQNEPGSCPICGMDLIRLETDTDMSDPMAVSMSPTAMQLADVMTQVVRLGKVSKTLRLNGKVMENEQQVYTQSSHIPGRVESLNVDFTGEYVQKGQIIATLYSPELVTAQQELFEAQKIQIAQPELFDAARKKLLNWKLTSAQIDQILENGQPIETLPIRAEKSGYVKEKKVNLGDYIKQGMTIYVLTDLSKVWVMFDAYESDMQWIKKGAFIDFTVSSFPGEDFSGKISYIDPVINPKTRVSMVRVEMNNPKNQLKPEMFASGVLQSSSSSEEKIVIPKSAVMWTGNRSVVYVKQPSDQGMHFKIREVTLGAALGDAYVIVAGLEAGEEITVNGTFSIDAAAQLAGKPSMMSPDGGVPMTGHNHGGGQTNGGSNEKPLMNHPEVNISEGTYDVSDAFRDQIKTVFDNYLLVKDAMVSSDAKLVNEKAALLQKAISDVNMELVQGDAHLTWMKDLAVLTSTAEMLTKETDIEKARMLLSPLSDQLFHSLSKYKVETKGFRQFCPMAFDNSGGFWLSNSEEILNPYFGDAMLTCGNVEEQLN